MEDRFLKKLLVSLRRRQIHHIRAQNRGRRFLKGITDAEANKLYGTDWEKAQANAKECYASHTGDGFDSLPKGWKTVPTDLAYGTKRELQAS